MTTDFGALLGSEMDESGIDDLLTEAGVGVLSMAADGVPYGVPLSFGYDGDDHLYFLFVGHSTELRKETYAERSPQASFAVFDVEPDGRWRSVVASGPIDRITPQRGTPPARRWPTTRSNRTSSRSTTSTRTRTCGPSRWTNGRVGP
jgi:nitroimidazol reductase NimA-like FMN-containing flavoprotein (pyridoxamine 5'-phosphate oxidase superfamily)